MRAINASIMRHLNRTLILNHIRLRPISRAELSDETGLTRASVTQIVEELIGEGLVMETSIVGRSRLGRRSTQLAIAPDAGVIFGVTLSREQYTVGAMNMRGTVLRQTTELIANHAPDEVLDSIANIIQQMSRELALENARILGVGVSAPGPIHFDRGCILNSIHFDAWHNLPIAQQLEARTGFPTVLHSIANAQALEAMYFGKAGENFALIRVDDTVSSSLIMRGTLHCGTSDFAVEIGQCPISADGGRTLNDMISIPALLAATPYNTLQDLVDHRAEPEACEAIDKLARYLSFTIVNMVYAYGINRIVLTGALDRAMPELLPALRQAVDRRLNNAPSPALLRSDSSPVRMAASVFYDTLFSLNI